MPIHAPPSCCYCSRHPSPSSLASLTQAILTAVPDSVLLSTFLPRTLAVVVPHCRPDLGLLLLLLLLPRLAAVAS